MILALETATPQSGVALVDERGLRAVRRSRIRSHSELLLGLIDECLAEAGATVADLAAVACGGGPGSFTGLRIGLATAKGLAFALGRPLLVVPSLQALARRDPPGALAVACLDAFKGEVYACFYRAGDEPVALGPEEAIAPPRLALRLRELLAREPLYLVGNGAQRWPELRLVGLPCADEAPPDPVDIGHLAWRRLCRGEVDDLGSAAPRYVRPSEAELHLAPDGDRRSDPTR